MVHHRQGLPLGFEAGDHLPGVHARLDDLQRDRALDRLGLLGHEHDAHAAFADLLQQLVGADDRARALGDWPLNRWRFRATGCSAQPRRWRFQEALTFFGRAKKRDNAAL